MDEILDEKGDEASGGTGVVVYSATLLNRRRLGNYKTAQCWQVQNRREGAAVVC